MLFPSDLSMECMGIFMNKPHYKLETFEGPLDLLLHLVTKHKFDICDIEISVLLAQYLEYIDGMKEQDFELAGEFLEMAARLIYIKTASLLPKPEEAQELKKELEGRLIEYALCKKMALVLRENYIGGDVFVRKQAKIETDMTYIRTHSPMEIYDAFMSMNVRSAAKAPVKESVFEPLVKRRVVSVISRIIRVLKALYTTGSCSLDRLYDNDSARSGRIATFLAVLELTKSGRIALSEDNTTVVFRGRSQEADAALAAQSDNGMDNDAIR
ncbi:MAG: segregation/condensation protein A [Oscillospiraceae bacterium]